MILINSAIIKKITDVTPTIIKKSAVIILPFIIFSSPHKTDYDFNV